MKPYAYSVVPSEDLALFNKIKRVIQEMPDVELGIDKNGKKTSLSCHILVRALTRCFPIEYQDGYFGDSCEHSWLITKNGLVIDAYPVAVVGGPVLVDTRYMTPWCYLYKKKSLSKLKGVRFQKKVDKVTEAVRQTMARIGI
jgi:hypothetical protein